MKDQAIREQLTNLIAFHFLESQFEVKGKLISLLFVANKYSWLLSSNFCIYRLNNLNGINNKSRLHLQEG